MALATKTPRSTLDANPTHPSPLHDERLPLVFPPDRHNATLENNVHPPDWVNPEPAPRYNLVVIGAGTAGLVAAAGAAGMGARVALVERHLMGGDCLNTGCVPSKSIIRSARLMGELRRAAAFGVDIPGGAQADFGAVMTRMRKIRAHISENDSARRFRDLGIDVFLGAGRFSSRHEVLVGSKRLRFKKAIIATGARAVLPDIEGIAEAGFHTNETIFSITELPARLAVIGGGPIGAELAQAFQRLGSEVTLLTRGDRILPRDDVRAAAVVQASLQDDGIRLVNSCHIERVEQTAAGKTLVFERLGKLDSITVDEVLVGAGRAPNVEGLGLEAAGVAYDTRRGVQVDDRLRTTQSHIYAAGDVAIEHKFTHAADFAARIVIQNSLFLGRARVSALSIPRCTYTSPELAQVGLTEAEARERGVAIDSYVRELRDVDRAIADGEDEGFVKIHVKKGTDRIVGATIVAAHAGDLISEVSVAMKSGLGLGKLAAVIHPYPTTAEAIRQIGDAYNRTRLTPLVKKLSRTWLAWTR